jgi:hypothetical protein
LAPDLKTTPKSFLTPAQKIDQSPKNCRGFFWGRGRLGGGLQSRGFRFFFGIRSEGSFFSGKIKYEKKKGKTIKPTKSKKKPRLKL